ncbi:sclerostin domain-containing protein 1a [Erpetoichthys calabaricus]|uniref:Sclerostin domain-containing protein 1 n=1 Tax=Erpetoichthys calabaricus TaxID=27687 RepID=A0A8C4SKM1_ERPCA|nr:sclerostin domain-containing protein 1a [Erpetoichthys calabaricus]
MLLYTPKQYVLLVTCFLIKSCATFKNDATENVYSQQPGDLQQSANNVTLNRARTGGRLLDSAQTDRNDRNQLGCRELRSTKYISDGQCTSINPVKELVCAGECLPAQMLPNWIGGGYGRKYWSRRNMQEWRCVTDKTRTQRIQLQCQDGSTRTYKITVVTSCKCKRYSRQHNESNHNFEETSPPKSGHNHKGKKRTGKTAKHQVNWHEMDDKN